jgi:flagellar basal-body rod protein FlgF
MDNSIYTSLSRQSGLMRELSVIANNIANSDTTGYKRESTVFSEYIKSAAQTGSADAPQRSISMGRLGAHVSHFESGAIRQTGGSLDVALDGEGFFTVETPQGERLTRAGHFITDAEGTLVMPNGYPVLDDGGGQIQIPLEVNLLAIGGDGTISADGVEIARLGVVTSDATLLTREGQNLWIAGAGTEPLETPKIIQGFLEGSNVQPVNEIARMIEVQRHYDAGQKLLDQENERIKSVISTIRQMP